MLYILQNNQVLAIQHEQNLQLIKIITTKILQNLSMRCICKINYSIILFEISEYGGCIPADANTNWEIFRTA